MGGFFKKPQPQESESGNRAYDEIENYFQPGLGYFTQGGDAMASLLGVGAPRTGTTSGSYSSAGGGAGGSNQVSALDNWANSGGMSWLMDQGNRMINSNQAAKGLLGSGSTLAAVQKYGQGLGSTYLNQYMDQLYKLSNLGLQGGGLMASAGQWSKGQGATQGGMGKQLLPMIGSAALTAAASDPALKENVELVGYDNDNTPVYDFDYKQDTPLDLPVGRFRGYMATDLPPSALGPKRGGFLTVADRRYFPKRIDD